MRDLKEIKKKLVKQTKANKNLCAGYPNHFDLYYSTLNCKVYIYQYYEDYIAPGESYAVILHPKNVDKNELKWTRNTLLYQFKGMKAEHIFTSQYTPKDN
nr:MAG TPA: hypothetical protein [Bacteriophage sp.]